MEMKEDASYRDAAVDLNFLGRLQEKLKSLPVDISGPIISNIVFEIAPGVTVHVEETKRQPYAHDCRTWSFSGKDWNLNLIQTFRWEIPACPHPSQSREYLGQVDLCLDALLKYHDRFKEEED